MPDQHEHAIETKQAIEALFDENRTFPPLEAFARQANLRDPDVYKQAAADFEKFWEGEAERLGWFANLRQSFV